MRAIAGGTVVLAFAVVLLSWDASRRFAHVRQPQPLPSSEIGSPRTNGFVISAPDVEAPGIEPAKSNASESPVGARALSSPSSSPAPETAPRRAPLASRLPAGVQQFAAGSKAHVAAIATAIDSEESQATVAPLARLYFAFFDRPSDFEGLNYWIDERDGGSSLEAIAEEFAGSTEFRLRYGALDNAAFFDRIYRNVFDSAPDAMYRAYWLAQLDAGMSRGQVMLAFSESNAFRAATSNEVFVTMAYAEALRREPDPAGFARWVRFLDAGNPREAVIAGLLGGTRTKR